MEGEAGGFVKKLGLDARSYGVIGAERDDIFVSAEAIALRDVNDFEIIFGRLLLMGCEP